MTWEPTESRRRPAFSSHLIAPGGYICSGNWRRVFPVKPLNLFLAMLLTLAMSAAVCARAPEQVPAIGAKLNKHWLTAGEHELCMTSPAQLDPCFEQAFEGVRYRVAYSSKSKRVTYLTTSDGKFRTHSGLRVGDEIASLTMPAVSITF